MELLESIERTRSISAAARAIDLSYKAAWDAVDAMNNLAERPLVARVKGGRGGGGSRLTPHGRKLLATFRALETENARFLERLNRRVQGAGEGLHLIGRLGMLTSARNHFAGRVTALVRGSVNDEIELTLPGGDRLVAIITRESTERLGIAVDSQLIALVKSSSVIVAAGAGALAKLSARNALRGRIERLTRGAVNSEVVIRLEGGQAVAAIITNQSARTLRLARGRRATAIFKASSVILGTAG